MAELETIRLSQLSGKNIVNIYDGVRLGVIYEPNLTFDPETGRLETLWVGGKTSLTGLWNERNSLQIPWEAVQKIGQEIVIVDMGQSPMRFKRSLF